MSVGNGLNAGEIDCVVSRLVVGVRWLGVLAHDELPDVTSEIGPFCLILNTDRKNQAVSHWLALYAFLSCFIELFYSFDLSPSIYSLDFLVP